MARRDGWGDDGSGEFIRPRRNRRAAWVIAVVVVLVGGATFAFAAFLVNRAVDGLTEPQRKMADEANRIEVPIRQLLEFHAKRPAATLENYGGRPLLLKGCIIGGIERSRSGGWDVECEPDVAKGERMKLPRLVVNFASASQLRIGDTYDFKVTLVGDTPCLTCEPN